MRQFKILLSLIILSAAILNLYSQEWPQYRGPDRNGISKEKGILRTWPKTGPEVLWSVDVGIGFGGPVVKDGKVYLLDRDDKIGDKLRCFDLASGKELWSFGYDAPGSVQFPGSRSVPAIDGNRIYTCGPYGHLYCIDVNTHKPLWNKNIWTDFGGGQIPRWAITQCPLVYGDLLIIASQAPQAGVVAYDKLTGNLKWKTPSLGPEGYVSPVIVKIGNEDHVVMISASAGRSESATPSVVAGIDPRNGKILWEYRGWSCRIPVPCAVDAGEGRILITGAYNAGSAMIKVQKKSDGSYEVSELYKNPDFGAHTQAPVLYNGHFYAQYSTNERKDGLVCMSIDGQVKWKTGREPLFDKGGMILADGLLLCTDGMTKLYLIEPDPTKFKPLDEAKILNEGIPESNQETAARYGSAQNWAALALAGGKLLVRDQTKLYCVKVSR